MAKKNTLQERIKVLQPYFLSIEVKENLYIVRVAYPHKWSAYNSDNELIKVTKSDTSKNEWFYYASIVDADLNEIFDLIEDTIQTNESVNKKIELMRVKMEELKDLFQVETLERLETLEFTFSSLKPNKRKYVRKKNVKKLPIMVKEELPSLPQEITEVTNINKNDISTTDETLYSLNDIDNIDL